VMVVRDLWQPAHDPVRSAAYPAYPVPSREASPLR
jgi:hypothetical protein